MALVAAPKGFFVSRAHGGMPGRVEQYDIASGYASNIFKGDLVKSAGDGSIALAGTADPYLGIFQGCYYLDSTGKPVWSDYWPASTAPYNSSLGKALVMNDPGVKLIAQCVGAVAKADIGQLTKVNTGTAGSTTFGTSGQAVDTAATGGTQFRINRIVEMPARDSNGFQVMTGADTYGWVELIQVRHEFQVAVPDATDAGVEQ